MGLALVLRVRITNRVRDSQWNSAAFPRFSTIRRSELKAHKHSAIF